MRGRPGLGCFGCEGDDVTLNKLGGWWRIWIVVAVLWVGVCCLVADWSRPDAKTVKSWPYTTVPIAEINQARTTLCTSGDLALVYGLSETHGELTMPTIAPIAKVPEQQIDLQCWARDGMRDKIMTNLAGIFSIPVILLLVGLTGRWVWRGFRSKQ